MPSSRNALPPTSLPAPHYAEMFGPTDRRPGPPRRHRTHHRGREGFHHLRRGGEVRRRQGDPRRHGPGADRPTRDGAVDTVITNALILDHWGIVKADVGLKDGLIAGDRQGRQSRHPAGRHHHRRSRHRSDRGRRQDPHRRRLRHAHPFHLPAADRRGARCPASPTMLGGGTGPATGTFATTCTPGPWHIAAHDRGRRRLSR